MPLYEYKCECNKTYLVKQSMQDEKFKKCSDFENDCKDSSNVIRLINSPTIISDDIGRGTKRMSDKDLYKELDEWESHYSKI